MAIGALSNVLSMDFKPTDVEIAIATVDGFKILTTDEIEVYLTRMIEMAD